MLDVISVFQTCIQKCCQRCNTESESESEDLRYNVKRKRSWGVYNRLMSLNLKHFKTDGEEKHNIVICTHREYM